MNHQFIYTSLTRISDLQKARFDIKPKDKSSWKNADYIAGKVIYDAQGRLKAEIHNGRMTTLMDENILIGALGERHATLEVTGSWKRIEEDGKMHLLTGAGLFGKAISKSFFIPNLVELEYMGHIYRNGKALNMNDFIPEIKKSVFNTPVILFVGTSMTAGKTTAARIITHMLKSEGLKVVGAKLTGAGRYKDILAVKDAGAIKVYDFVDVGLPSSICSPETYISALEKLLSLIQSVQADIAILEIGASPLEPYNGDLAIEEIREHIKATILCASDPYAVYGVMKSFDISPTIVSGPATNTLGGIDLIHKLCKVKALNIIDFKTHPELLRILKKRLRLNSVNHISS